MMLVQEGHWREEKGLFLMSSPPTALHVNALRVWELEKQAAGELGSVWAGAWKGGLAVGRVRGQPHRRPLESWSTDWAALVSPAAGSVSNTEYGSGASPLNKAFDSTLDSHVNCGSFLVNVYNVLGRLGKIYGECNLLRPIWDGAGFKAFLSLGEGLSSLRARWQSVRWRGHWRWALQTFSLLLHRTGRFLCLKTCHRWSQDEFTG